MCSSVLRKEVVDYLRREEDEDRLLDFITQSFVFESPEKGEESDGSRENGEEKKEVEKSEVEETALGEEEFVAKVGTS